MENQDVRWKQRFEHFLGAYKQLKNASEIKKERQFSELERQGVIQAFEVTQELSWKVLKDFLEEQGYVDLIGSKNSIKEAFNTGLISNGEIWLDMIKSRNLTSHIYDEEEVLKIIEVIFQDYMSAFEELENKMKNYL